MINDESALLALLKKGNIKGYEILYHQYYPRFYHFSLGLVKDKWIAEDITQNVFMKLWIYRERLDENLSLYSYIYVLSKNEILNYFRSKSHQTMNCQVELKEEMLSVPDVEDDCINKEMKALADKVISMMPPKRRTIFQLNRFDSKSPKEIALELGLSVRTVEKHIELALRDMRKNMGPFFPLIIFLLTIG